VRYPGVVSGLETPTVEPLGRDIVTIAQCIAIDVASFPYPSIPFDLARPHAGARVWVTRDSERRVTGFLAALARIDLDIVGLAVDRGARRRGVGRALLRRAMTAATSDGTGIVLQVSTSNVGALALYRSEGFVARRRLRGFYARGIYPDHGDAVEMAWPRSRSR